MSNDIYYHLSEDIEKYPSALWYLIIGGRATGKTYSSINYALDNYDGFCFIKRTAEEVKNMCLSMPRQNGEKDVRESSTPFEAINRDRRLNIRAFKSNSIFGYFHNCNELNYPVEDAIGTIIPLSKVQDAKGFEVPQNCKNFIIYDEFIPQEYTRNTSWNGIQMLDLVQTILRDELVKEDCDTKIVCLANATSADNPLMSELRVVDIVEQMQDNGIEELYLEDKFIYIHILPDNTEFMDRMKRSKFAKSIEGTAYYDMSMCNKFAYNDFSLVKANWSLAGMKPEMVIIYKGERWTYLSGTKNNFITKRKIAIPKDTPVYDLKREADQGEFREFVLDYLYTQLIAKQLYFETYEIYSTILNFCSKFPKSKQN